MHLTGIDFSFWAVGLLENLALLFVLSYRRLAKSFPFFTALAILSVIRTIVLYFVHSYGTKDSYFYTYWSLAILDTDVAAWHRLRDCQPRFSARRCVGARCPGELPLDGGPERYRGFGTQLAGKPAGANVGGIVCHQRHPVCGGLDE